MKREIVQGMIDNWYGDDFYEWEETGVSGRTA